MKSLKYYLKKPKFIHEIQSNKVLYILLGTVLVVALFLRTYRLNELLGFYYDQGRDALVIWDLWTKGKLFLIGPTTGLHGIFLGPFFYYLLAPFYLISGGNPILPAIFLAFLSVLAIAFGYFLVREMRNRIAGVIFVVIASFSYYIVLAGRWLSNPTPILLTSVLLLYSLWRIVQTKNRRYWYAVALLVGVSLHFEAASAFFYILIVMVFFVWQYGANQKIKDKSDFKKNFSVYFFSIFIFILTLLPQILFNIRHDNILFSNFWKTIVEKESFQTDIQTVLHIRIQYFWDVFSSKIVPGNNKLNLLYAFFALCALCIKKDILLRIKVIPIFLIFLGVPVIGYTFFQGNEGNLYDYYLTGYYLPSLILFSIGLSYLWDYKLGKVLLGAFIYFFLVSNFVLLKNYLTTRLDGSTHISYGNQFESVQYIFSHAESFGISEYNIDVYVPPVIPYTYDYLFLWQGTKICGASLCGNIKDKMLKDLYILYEVDPPHPERLDTWLAKYKENTIIESERKFGGIIIQKRTRI